MTADLSRAPKWRPASAGDSSVTGSYLEARCVCVCVRVCACGGARGMCVCVCVCVHAEEPEETQAISPTVPRDGSTSVDASVSS